jgi:lipopolysaccharide/colanic/teichoic acid biosynthesis glycosyltransferase
VDLNAYQTGKAECIGVSQLDNAAQKEQRSNPSGVVSRRVGEPAHSAAILKFPEAQNLAVDLRGNLARMKATVAMKRAMDIVLSIAAMIVLSPVLLTVAALIRLTSAGPAVFRQRRTGQNGKEFVIYKFRTMHIELQDVSGVRHTVQNDPRVTSIGRFLRKYSIDELPQLANVLMGEMSIVGPRAHAVGMLALGVPYDQFVRDYDLRHLVKPGLTGQAQVKGYRGEVCDEAHARGRVAEDLDYVRNLSLWRDVKIMALTLPAVISGKSAF